MSRKTVPSLLIAFVTTLGILGTIARAADGIGALFDLGVSARSLGVGGARAAFSDDAAAATLNPAALGWVRGINVASLVVDEFGGVAYGSVAFSAPYVGVSALVVDSGWIASGDSGFRFAAQGIGAAAAVPLGPVGVGARWRFLRYGAPFEGHGWALDGGLLLDLGALRVGAICDAALSAPMAYEGEKTETWKRNLCLGAAVTLTPIEDVMWTATADVDGILHGPWRIIGGLEIWVASLAARLGWDGEGPTFGLSVRVSGIELDWSCAARPDLGTSHRVSLEVLF
ncbi:MAG: hypothetical protein NTX23_00580 [Candidatus Bipolaricaulota bacterium]|nr:hypothetical protein [Candidatus Bipolaricaulota bacterium]